MSFREKVKSEIEIFKLKFKEAREAHQTFKNKLTLAYRRSGQTYQIPFDYKMGLEQFKLKTESVNSLIIPALKALNLGEITYLPRLFAYLALQERYFRSGYIKEGICKGLKKIEFTEEQKSILVEIILINVEFAGREVSQIVSLIPKIDRESIKEALIALQENPSDVIKKRVKWILQKYW